MANNVQVQKTVLSKAEFVKVIDTTFRTYTQPVINTGIDTIDEFFRLYEELYFEIDVLGDTDSHEYLVKKSSELLTFDTVTENIQPLLDEIAQLRIENLALNQELVSLQTNTA
jgi:hypothetical protein